MHFGVWLIMPPSRDVAICMRHDNDGAVGVVLHAIFVAKSLHKNK